jgi:hypothetical protein
VIWLPAPFRARITDPPTVRFEPDPCEPQGIPRPTDADERAHGQPNPPSADAPPVPTAGAGRPTPPAPADPPTYGAAGEHPYHWADGPADCLFCQQFAAYADDYTEAFGNTDGLRIRAVFEKGKGRP